MRTAWKPLSVTLLLAALIAVGALVVLEAAAQTPRPESVRWEYAWVYVPAEGAPVFTTAERELTILPSSEPLSGAVDSVQQGLRKYKVQSRSVRDDGAGALDIAGSEGWEAVGLVAYRSGVKVLLRRPR